MFTRDQLINQFKMIDSEGKGALPYDKIVIVCQSLGMNTTGHKVIEYFQQHGTHTPALVTPDEFVEWFKKTNPNVYKDQ